MSEIIKSSLGVSEETLLNIQEDFKSFPEVIENKEQSVKNYDSYQIVRRLRIALVKKAKEFVTHEKTEFEKKKEHISFEELRILNILSPIEKTLLSRRTDWEEKQEKIKQEAADEAAKIQKEEFDRQEKIRDEIQAWKDAAEFDARKAADLIRKQEEKRFKEAQEKLATEKAEFEKKKSELDARERELELQEEERIQAAKYDKDWAEAHEKNMTRGDSELEKCTEALAAADRIDISLSDLTGESSPLGDDKLVAVVSEISGEQENTKTADVQLIYSLDVFCPYCQEEIDLVDVESDSEYSKPMFEGKWDQGIKGETEQCPNPDCEKYFVLGNLEY